jgi:hypothetical protein
MVTTERRIAPDFTFWEGADPETFLAHDHESPVRAYATARAIALAEACPDRPGLLGELGPGPGVDYERAFRMAVSTGAIEYVGVEGTKHFVDSLRARFPNVGWHHGLATDLAPEEFDVLYAKDVFEHQPSLTPALTAALAAARYAAVIVWYRAPTDGPPSREMWRGVDCVTWPRPLVLQVVTEAGFWVVETVDFPGNATWPAGHQCWTLERITDP